MTAIIAIGCSRNFAHVGSEKPPFPRAPVQRILQRSRRPFRRWDRRVFMVSQPLSVLDAEDIDVLGIEPKRELRSCNHLLGDHEALMRFHDEEGYILLRNVLDAGSIAAARQA